MNAVKYLYPNGGSRAVTFSYDDGRTQDRRLVELFNKHGMKATFHLNSGLFGEPGYIDRDECKDLYEGHEIAGHTCEHPFLSYQPAETALPQLTGDRRELERIAGYPVRGFSYPFGDTIGHTPDLVKAAGFDYARTTISTNGVLWPEDFILWNPSCHHYHTEIAMTAFTRKTSWHHIRLLYIWGHSYEFDNNDDWHKALDLCKVIDETSDVWKATNVEVYRYVNAVRNLKWSVDMTMCENPSAVTVMFEKEGNIREIKPGINMF